MAATAGRSVECLQGLEFGVQRLGSVAEEFAMASPGLLGSSMKTVLASRPALTCEQRCEREDGSPYAHQ